LLYKFVRNIFHSKNNSAIYYHKPTHIGLHLRYLLFFSDFNVTGIFPTDFQQLFKHETPYNPVHSRVFPYRHTDGQTDTTKLIVPFHDFDKASRSNKFPCLMQANNVTIYQHLLTNTYPSHYVY